MKRITSHDFAIIKHGLRNKFTTARNLANRYEVSLKTVYQIRGSKDFGEYTQQNKAQHPDTKFSLAESVLELHDMTFNRHDNKYLSPKSAKQAIGELIRNA
jgi:hypothetical protein